MHSPSYFRISKLFFNFTYFCSFSRQVLAVANFTDPCAAANFSARATIPASATRYAFTALQPATRYCFRIHALNRHTLGAGVNAPAFADATPVRLPETRATNLRVTSKANAIDDQEGAWVALAWDAPGPAGGPVERYMIAYWPQSDAECLQQGTEVNCRSYKEFGTLFTDTSGIVTGLRPATRYYFLVLSGNLNGFEREGSSVLGPVETSKLPGPVTSLRVTSITDTTITLSWSNPASPEPAKMRLEYLVLETGVREQEEFSCTMPFAACPVTKTWPGLSAAFSYRFSVFTGAPPTRVTRSCHAHAPDAGFQRCICAIACARSVEAVNDPADFLSPLSLRRAQRSRSRSLRHGGLHGRRDRRRSPLRRAAGARGARARRVGRRRRHAVPRAAARGRRGRPGAGTPPPLSPLVLIGHAASLTPY